jgi:hypothetical protein
MKWYKKQMAELLKKQQKNDSSTTKVPSQSLPKPKKVIRHGLEKRSRPKTDSIS